MKTVNRIQAFFGLFCCTMRSKDDEREIKFAKKHPKKQTSKDRLERRCSRLSSMYISNMPVIVEESGASECSPCRPCDKRISLEEYGF